MQGQILKYAAHPQEASVVVVAEHALVRSALCVLLNQAPGLAVVAECEDLRGAIALASALHPDVVLLASQPETPADAALLHALDRTVPNACVLCLAGSVNRESPRIICLPRDAGVAEFTAQLRSVLPRRCTTCLLAPQCGATRVAVALSPREWQVAVRVARGMSTKQIAATLGIRPRTVSTYREGLARKLGASSAAVVTRYVLEHGLDPAGVVDA
ncbi:MAG: response regulator transcription factor [Gemmatimonadaceae bacterium]